MTVHATAGDIRSVKLEIANWAALHPQDLVTVRYDSGLERIGVIDEVSDKGDVVWIEYSHPALRKLVHKSEAVRIRCEPSGYPVARIAALVQPPDKVSPISATEKHRYP